MSRLNQNSDNRADSEDGFALYLAVGFIVLISVLAGSVGTKLNIAALSEARKNDRRAALDEAEAGLSIGWEFVRTGYASGAVPNWLAAETSATDINVSGDLDKCVAPFEDSSGFFASARVDNGERARRYFVKYASAASYHIYGCGFDDKSTRIAFGLYDISGNTLVLNRVRRY